jgi:hypothetical protein
MTMLKKIKLIFIAVFFGLLILLFFTLEKVWSFPDTEWPLTKGDKEKIRTEVVQKFKANRDGLARIKILFGSSDVSPGGTFDFKLLDEDCRKTVRSAKFDITSLGSDNTTDFIFPKIKDSKNKTYCLSIGYAQKKGGKKAEIFITDNTKPENVYFSINGEQMQGKSIPMRPAYKNATLFGDINELNQRISQYKPWFLKHYYLYFIAFGFLILSIILLTALIII